MEPQSELSPDSSSQSSQDSNKVKIPPTYSNFGYLYPGIEIDEEGYIDLRVRFAIPFDIDLEKVKVTYLVYPYGAKSSEFEEKDI